MTQLSLSIEGASLECVEWTPGREAGLRRMAAFTPRMGRAYAGKRNYDYGRDRRANVSALSPWIRTRLVLEEEAAAAALNAHGLSPAEKFLQEVCWRTYFKGWLEHRPGVWTAYLRDLKGALDACGQDAVLRKRYEAAITGRTGIDCFDAWASELVETGYLHNHARMWFASIWIFTLKLPWVLGADFFLTYLMDGDAASNTCSWRWVAGLHTAGKTYLARSSNIKKYTDGRFDPEGLAAAAPALEGDIPAPGVLPPVDPPPDGPIALLLTEEDLGVETLRPPGAEVKALAGVSFAADRGPNGVGAQAAAFAAGALEDALDRGAEVFGVKSFALAGDATFTEVAAAWARASECKTVVTGFPAVGWVRPRLEALSAQLKAEGVALRYLQRPWDALFWPHAKKGFFGLKKAMPSVLAELGLPV
ncbi:MAG: FAD-binding domain-containing protein [Pseudomonadota bacterium]